MSKRSLPQNASLHVYCGLMAEGLNNTQSSVQMVCTLPIEWTMENFKENIWKPVQHSMFPEITSTTQLSTTQVNEVYEQINKIMGENWHVTAPWPSVEEQRLDTFNLTMPDKG